MGHIPREFSCHVYNLIKTEGNFVNGTVKLTKYHPSPIPSGGLEILLLFKFSCPEKMKNFFDSLYDHDYNRVNDEEGSDEGEAAIVTETD